MLAEGCVRVNIIRPAAQALVCLFRFEEEAARLFGQRLVDDDAEGVFGDEGRDAPDLSAERRERDGRGFLIQFRLPEGFGRAAEGAAESVEGEVAAGQDFPALLKVAQGVEDEARGVALARLGPRVEE